MRLDDAFRQLELGPDASDDDVRRAWRDLAKVWHPDRFGHDPELRRRAEEKSKALNEAVEAIREGRRRAARASGDAEARAATPGGRAGREPAAAEARRRFRTDRARAFLAAGAAVFLLLRRPTPAGLAIALVLLGAALVFLSRMRRAAREEEAASLPEPEA